MIPKQEEISIMILAGGRGTRMDGADKGLIMIDGDYIINHLIDLASKVTKNVYINANRNIETYSELNVNIVQDVIDDYQGPLAGIYSGLLNIKTEYLLTIPCDCPFVSELYFSRMIKDLHEKKIKCAFSNDRIQPVHALIPKDYIDSLKKFLDGGKRKIDQWYTQESFSLVDFSDLPDIFVNINNNEDLIKYKSRIKARITK